MEKEQKDLLVNSLLAQLGIHEKNIDSYAEKIRELEIRLIRLQDTKKNLINYKERFQSALNKFRNEGYA